MIHRSQFQIPKNLISDRRRLGGIAFVAGVLLTALPVPAALGQQKVVVGQPYPDILLPRIDTREPVTLSQFRGKKVLLIQFASW